MADQADIVDADPKASHPSLNLSGRIISATFDIPFRVGFTPDQEWDLKPRRGNAALYDSFTYLSSSKSSWNHTFVGWTGEIRCGSASTTATPVSPQPPGQKTAEFSSRPRKPSCVGLRIKPLDRRGLEKQLERNIGGKIVPVWLADEVDRKDDTYVIKNQTRWRKFAEKELYTVFHYKSGEPADGPSAKQAWADYYRMNQLFAQRILEVYNPGDIIIVHDYNLMLLPGLLRQKLPHVYTGFFLHIPFPSSEYFRCIGKRKELLEGVLGANMIGFQADGYSRHFSSCCTRLLDVESSATSISFNGKQVATDAFPIGIDAMGCEKCAYTDATVVEKMAGIRRLYAGKKMIIGRDRLDTVRGVAQKLQAFEIFLERYPEWHGKAVLIQITSPSDTSTDSSEGESKVLDKISDLATKINGLYGSISFTPVQHFPQYLDKEEYFALLRVADVALITSVRDGMNTTSLEYVVCQKDNHSPLILSEFSGTSGSLTGAIHVNPWDLGGVAEALNHALLMTADARQEQNRQLYNHVVTNNIQTWTNRYINRLLETLDSSNHFFTTPILTTSNLPEVYTTANKRLFLFDYDGTLTPIVTRPEDALPTPRLISTLKALAADPKNAVWIISGRDQTFLSAILGDIAELGLSAEHGSFMRRPRKSDWINCAEDEDMTWQKPISDIFLRYTDDTPGSFLETKKVALTWHYRLADPEHGLAMESACYDELEIAILRGGWDVEVMRGKMNLEVRPRFVNKGVIAGKLIKEYNNCGDGDGGEGLDFVLCVGDDGTDEDMFRALRLANNLDGERVFSVSIGYGGKQTLAGWHLEEPEDVVGVLEGLAGIGVGTT
ncbi:glycosyltransferase family 20 protein [Tothia fuscella]|uniref:Glycosyltransferase family 20 protein n=1 Tax=Tothia fuscella TaxID=1048955 RepID=A0A9P4P3J8_9PEZI|nr:glycosyltransferase family 20 protein [Tothia fuscella]